LARRCSRDTATLEGWIKCASTPRALSQRANQKPSRPASKANAIRVILRPALTASSRQRWQQAKQPFCTRLPLSTILALTRFRDNVLKAKLPGANLRASYPNSQIRSMPS
jgi:hypothetical protein